MMTRGNSHKQWGNPISRGMENDCTVKERKMGQKGGGGGTQVCKGKMT